MSMKSHLQKAIAAKHYAARREQAWNRFLNIAAIIGIASIVYALYRILLP